MFLLAFTVGVDVTVAEHLSLSQDTVRTWIKEGKLPVYKAGKRYKFKISEVDEWVREGKIKE